MVCKILVYFRLNPLKIKQFKKVIFLIMKWTNDEMDDSMDEKLGNFNFFTSFKNFASGNDF